ncbi:MAG: shikimate dehydrogenase [Firmicutes bacterium]|nr:shikimate dehydrogenase [Bacillota bacterium]
MIQETIRLYGLFGDPVGHSLSPFFQNEAFKTLGINAVYFPFTVKAEDLAGAVAAIRHLNMGGVNLTIPHKEAVIPLLDKVEGDAALSGSVNTIVNRGGELTGYSTDGEGFLLSLEREAGFDPRGKVCIILGAGGAARAVAFRLAQEEPAALYLVNRGEERATALQEDLRSRLGFQAEHLTSPTELEKAAVAADLVINATPVGMYPESHRMPAFPLEYCRPGCLVCDLVYRPLETIWLKKAGKLGLSVLGGLGMLIYQGMLSCQLWTGRMPEEAPLRAAVMRILDR